MNVGDGIRGYAAFPGDERGGVSQWRSENETFDVASFDPRLAQRRADRFWDDLRETFVSNPAFFPHVIVLAVVRPKLVDEGTDETRAAEQLGNDFARADREGGRSRSVRHFLKACRLPCGIIADDEQSRARCAMEHREQSADAGALRSTDIENSNVRPQMQRTSH